MTPRLPNRTDSSAMSKEINTMTPFIRRLKVLDKSVGAGRGIPELGAPSRERRRFDRLLRLRTWQRAVCAAAGVVAVLAAGASLAATPAQAAPQPWWQLLTGSRPTNLQPAPDQSETQEVVTEKLVVSPSEQIFAATVEVGGEPIGCLGAGSLLGGALSAEVLCEEEAGFPVTETAAGFGELLEAGPYGAGVEVTGGPAGGEPFLVTTTGRWVSAPIVLRPLDNPFLEGGKLGRASSKVTSEGSGILTITLTDLGDAPVNASEVPLAIHDTLPSGVQAYEARAIAGGTGEVGPVNCALPDTSELACSFHKGAKAEEDGKLPPYEAIEVEVLVALEDAAGAQAGEVSVSGADAPAVSRPQPLHLSAEPVPFGLEYFSMNSEEEGGEEAAAAGSHPFQLTTTLVADTGAQSGPDRRDSTVAQPALPRNLRFTLPAGLIGNATAVPSCDMATFLNNQNLVNRCPAESAIGASSVTVIESSALGLTRIAVPVFNLPPGRGEPARFGFLVAGDPVVVDTSVNPGNSYRIAAEVRNITQVVQFLSSTTTLWGDPGAKAHDFSRGWKCVYHRTGVEELPGACPDEPTPSERHDTPFLRLPVSCAAPQPFDAAFEPWNVPIGSLIVPASSESPPPGACNHLPFDPSLSDALTSKLASNPSGLDIRIDMPNSGLENPAEGAISETQFKRAEVTFPKGLTINPSQAEGLAVCSEADYARERYDSKPGEGCPEASKIGSIQISTPLLDEEAQGSLYVAAPYQNPGGSLIALYVVAKVPDRGILVKQPIEVHPDPVTGQLVGVSDDVPQLPFSSFKLHFREGGRSPLITPPGCGTFTTTAKFTPWSAQNPDDPDPSEVVERQASFTVNRGVNGGACPQGPAPFHPGFEAGTLGNQAGSYSPFVLHLTREDGEQDMGKFSFVLPPGVVGKLAGIPYCPEAGIARAQSRQGPHGGQEERSDPSCSAASQIGRTVAGAGVGNQLTYVSGKLYLAGPWHGDPLSVVAITPAVAGPFDVGTVVVREALRLNPLTARAEVDGAASDPIPHILKGIPLNLRDLRVSADRPEFTLNATSCEPFQAESTIWGDGTALQPLAQTPITLSSRYQAAGCASLGFKPKLALKLKGGTKRGKFPALNATYTPRPGDANLSRLALLFPHSEFIEQGHFGTICTRVQFAAGAGNGEQCPPASVYGQVTAYSPLLAEPLSGPVYLRSSSHNLPDAVFALHGLVNIDVVVRIDSKGGGLRATVEGAPDAPVSKAIVEMQGGRKGLFINSTNLCKGTHKAQADLVAQNGKTYESKPALVAKCPKAKKGKKKHKAHHKRGGRG